jgi:SNF2 family DNA or RNA helicase
VTTATAPALWDHQAQAIEFALERRATLFHMGLGTGKSRCAIEVARRAGAKSVLILCPLSVCDAWLDQFAKFGPEFRLAVLSRGSVAKKASTAKKGRERATAYGGPFVCVVNYESARNAPLAGWLGKQRFELLIMDESHRIKSPSGITSRWVSRLAQTCGKRLALTGTPMPHSPLDVYAQFRALDPQLFGWSFTKFRRRFAIMGGFQMKQVVSYTRIDELREKMARITFQASRDVLDLPEAIHEQRLIDLPPKAKKMYAEMERDFCTWVREGQEVTAANSLVKLLRLAQLTSGRVTVETDTDHELVKVHDAKEKALADLLTDLPMDEPVVAFGRFRADLASVHAAAKATGRGSLELSGSKRQLQEWQRGDAPILAVQIQSGGTGIDLTRAAYCVYLSAGYSLGDYEQSLARVHRPGQNRPVAYYHIVAKGTVDEKVYAALRDRKQVVEAILDGIQGSA